MELVIVFKVNDQTEALELASALQGASLHDGRFGLMDKLNGVPILSVSTYQPKEKPTKK